MLMRIKLFYFATILIFSLSSCATIFTGTKDVLSFNSDPKGAEVYIDGFLICKTPCLLEIERSLREVIAEIKLDGYETRMITLDREFNLVSIANFSGLLGWGIDTQSGALMRYGKKNYDIELDEDTKSSMIENASKIEINTQLKQVDIFVTE